MDKIDHLIDSMGRIGGSIGAIHLRVEESASSRCRYTIEGGA